MSNNIISTFVCSLSFISLSFNEVRLDRERLGFGARWKNPNPSAATFLPVWILIRLFNLSVLRQLIYKIYKTERQQCLPLRVILSFTAFYLFSKCGPWLVALRTS